MLICGVPCRLLKTNACAVDLDPINAASHWQLVHDKLPHLTLQSLRAATWPQAAYHTVTAVVGAGVLGLPFAFSYLGWAVGILFLILCALSSLYTGWQLASMHELDGKRLGRYRDLGVHVLGPLWGRVAVVPFQFLVMVRTCAAAFAGFHVRVAGACLSNAVAFRSAKHGNWCTRTHVSWHRSCSRRSSCLLISTNAASLCQCMT